MKLSGTNKKCIQCNQECKQYEQIKIHICPNFESINKKASS